MPQMLLGMVVRVAAVFGLTNLVMSAEGLVRFPSSLTHYLGPSIRSGSPTPSHSSCLIMPTEHLRFSIPVMSAGGEGGGGGGWGQIFDWRKKTPCAMNEPLHLGGSGRRARANTDSLFARWPGRRVKRVLDGAGGSGEGGLSHDGDSQERQDRRRREGGEEGEEENQRKTSMRRGEGITNDTGDGEDPLEMLSSAAVVEELQSRMATKTATTSAGEGGGVRGGGEEEGEEDYVRLPRFFPSPLPRDGDGEDITTVRPLVELPLDGILLQLFPALLIGVLGTLLTITVQVEANKFDGMVGDDGGAVVVTDLRDTRTERQLPR